MQQKKQLTAYLAHLNKVTDYHRAICADLTERGFPCIISNDLVVPNEREFPYASPTTARENLSNRIVTIKDSSLAFFFLFMEDSQRNELAAFELGLALQTSTNIVFIGAHPRSPQHFTPEGERIIRAYDYENFAAQRYLQPEPFIKFPATAK